MEEVLNLIDQNIWSDIIETVLLIFIPYLAAWIISIIGKYLYVLMCNTMPKATRYLIPIGTLIHELAHAIFALAFGHHIKTIKLSSLKHSMIDASTGESLNGYVETTYKKSNGIARVGKYFIGLAPIWVCYLLIALSFYVLLGSPISLQYFQGNLNIINGTNILIKTFANTLITLFSSNFFKVLMFLIIFFLISLSGFNLSDLDFKMANEGIAWISCFLLILIMFLDLIGLKVGLQMILIKLLIIFLIMTSLLVIFLTMLTTLVWIICKSLKKA